MLALSPTTCGERTDRTRSHTERSGLVPNAG